MKTHSPHIHYIHQAYRLCSLLVNGRRNGSLQRALNPWASSQRCSDNARARWCWKPGFLAVIQKPTSESPHWLIQIYHLFLKFEKIMYPNPPSFHSWMEKDMAYFQLLFRLLLVGWSIPKDQDKKETTTKTLRLFFCGTYAGMRSSRNQCPLSSVPMQDLMQQDVNTVHWIWIGFHLYKRTCFRSSKLWVRFILLRG